MSVVGSGLVDKNLGSRNEEAVTIDSSVARVADVDLGRAEYGVGGSVNPSPTEAKIESWPNLWKRQLDDAREFTDKVRELAKTTYPDFKLTITGHSVGGAVANVEGARTGIETHACDAPGVKTTIETLYPDRPTSQIYNHSRSGDVVSKVSDQVGQVLDHPSPQWTPSGKESEADWGCPHRMEMFRLDLGDGMSNNPVAGYGPAINVIRAMPVLEINGAVCLSRRSQLK